MKSFYRFAFLIPLFLSFVVTNVQAQSLSTPPPSQMHIDRSHMANPRYDFMVSQAMMHMSDNFRFSRFRTHYADTRQYDPFGDEIVRKIQALAYIVQSTQENDQRSAALDGYRNLVMAHMANIRVVAQALSLSRSDRNFGSPVFFEWLQKGLTRAILGYGDGNTLRSAYSIITMSEEIVLLGQLGLRVVDTQSANEGNIYYNMHTVEDLRTQKRSTVFVNTSRPLKYLNAQRAETGTGFSILRQ